VEQSSKLPSYAVVNTSTTLISLTASCVVCGPSCPAACIRPFTEESPAYIEHAFTNIRSISGHDETSSEVTERAGASGSERNVMKPLILVDIFRCLFLFGLWNRVVWLMVCEEANIVACVRVRKSLTSTISETCAREAGKEREVGDIFSAAAKKEMGTFSFPILYVIISNVNNKAKRTNDASRSGQRANTRRRLPFLRVPATFPSSARL